MGHEQSAPVNESILENKERIANMINEGGLGAMYYYNYEFYDERDDEKQWKLKMQDTTQQPQQPNITSH